VEAGEVDSGIGTTKCIQQLECRRLLACPEMRGGPEQQYEEGPVQLLRREGAEVVLDGGVALGGGVGR
jgi:hypothetical protein